MTPWLNAASSPRLLLDASPPLPLATVLFFAVMGSVWGSYLNVVVYRLPRGLSTAVPGSHCPRCAHRIRPWENVPVLSFLLLGGRCRRCGGAISWRYPLVEAATAAIFVVAGLRFASWSEIFAGWYLGFVLLALALIDLDRRVLPQTLTLPALFVVLLAQPILGWTELVPALAAALLCGLGLEGLSRWWRWLTGERGFGIGDAHLLALLGAAFGPAGCLRVLFVALLAAFFLGVPARFVGLISRKRGLPFGTFLAFAGLWRLLLDPAGPGLDRIYPWIGAL